MGKEVLTTWILEDPNNRFIVTDDDAVWDGVRRNETTHLSKAKVFSGSFIHVVKFEIDPAAAEAGFTVSYGLSDVLKHYKATFNDGDYELAFYGSTFGGTFFIQIDEVHNGSQYVDFWAGGSEGTTYWAEFEVDKNVGSFGQLIFRVYPTQAMTTPLDTMTLLLHEDVELQYALIGQSFNDGQPYVHSGSVGDVDFQEGAQFKRSLGRGLNRALGRGL